MQQATAAQQAALCAAPLRLTRTHAAEQPLRHKSAAHLYVAHAALVSQVRPRKLLGVVGHGASHVVVGTQPPDNVVHLVGPVPPHRDVMHCVRRWAGSLPGLDGSRAPVRARAGPRGAARKTARPALRQEPAAGA